jgi:hypothetical protein
VGSRDTWGLLPLKTSHLGPGRGIEVAASPPGLDPLALPGKLAEHVTRISEATEVY